MAWECYPFFLTFELALDSQDLAGVGLAFFNCHFKACSLKHEDEGGGERGAEEIVLSSNANIVLMDMDEHVVLVSGPRVVSPLRLSCVQSHEEGG